MSAADAMPAEGNDADLVVAAQQRGSKGQAAFERLVARHQEWLVRLLAHLLGDRSDAEDVAQEAFVRAFVALDACSRPAGFRTWLRVIARRLAFNHRRDARTRARYQDSAGTMRSSSANPQSNAVESRQLLERTLAEVSYAYREIMVLRFVEELSLKDVAAALEIGESAAKMRLSRARAEFEKIYTSLGGEVADA